MFAITFHYSDPLIPFQFDTGFEGWIWVLIASVPDFCIFLLFLGRCLYSLHSMIFLSLWVTHVDIRCLANRSSIIFPFETVRSNYAY